MANSRSESIEKVITNTSEPDVYVTPTWTYFWAYLESAADGDNFLSCGGSFVRLEPGVTVKHIVAPGTLIKVKTSSSGPVRWVMLFTPLGFLDELFGC